MSELDINAKASGAFRIQKTNIESGDVYFDSGEFSNNLLNNFFSSSSANLVHCFVGSDASVSNTDTALTSIGSTGSVTRSVTSEVDGQGKVTWKLISTFSFASGAVIGNMSCIGISSSSEMTGTNLKIKSLIKDVNGDPTAITATATDQITVTHTLTLTWNQSQPLGSVSIDGVNYDATFYTTLFSDVNLGVINNENCFTTNPFGSSPSAMYSSFTPPTIPSLTSAFITTAIGKVNLQNVTKTTSENPISGIMQSTYTFSAATTDNLASNAPIAAVGIIGSTSNSNNFMIVRFSPPLPKDASIGYTFKINLTISRA